LFALAAFLWLPASAHCQLETAFGFELLCCHSDAPATHTPCTEGCCSVEQESYHFKTTHQASALPDLSLIPSPSPKVSVKPFSTDARLKAFTPESPHWLKTWQFAFRTAAPPRSPSFAS